MNRVSHSAQSRSPPTPPWNLGAFSLKKTPGLLVDAGIGNRRHARGRRCQRRAQALLELCVFCSQPVGPERHLLALRLGLGVPPPKLLELGVQAGDLCLVRSELRMGPCAELLQLSPGVGQLVLHSRSHSLLGLNGLLQPLRCGRRASHRGRGLLGRGLLLAQVRLRFRRLLPELGELRGVLPSESGRDPLLLLRSPPRELPLQELDLGRCKLWQPSRSRVRRRHSSIGARLTTGGTRPRMMEIEETCADAVAEHVLPCKGK